MRLRPRKTRNSVDMECSISAQQQPVKSFNPEAATFRPVFSSPVAQVTESASSRVTNAPSLVFPMAPMFNYSPFQASDSMHSIYRRDPLTPAPVRLEDFLTPDTQALIKKLEEHPDIQELLAPHTPAPRITRNAQATTGGTANLPPFRFPAQQVDIDELSAGLGLPAMSVDTNDASPAISHKSRRSQAHPGALYGLAAYLQSPDLDTPSIVPAATPPPTLITATPLHQRKETIQSPPQSNPTTKLRNVKDSPQASVAASIENSNVPNGPTTFQHQHRHNSNSSAPFRQHIGNPSNRRFGRRTSRAKRMDQGPMPSAADIYPDDANWTPSAPIYEGTDYLSYHNHPFEQSQMVVDNAFNWPTPAQVYKPEPAPTASDIDDADIDVLTLMSELPEPSPVTLAKLGALQYSNAHTGPDLPCDSRALTPAQFDGSRYGMKFHGIALGDEWELPKIGDFSKGEDFRIRPREHDGWGGWEWALRKGRGI